MPFLYLTDLTGNLWARLNDGNHAYKMFSELLNYVEPDGAKTSAIQAVLKSELKGAAFANFAVYANSVFRTGSPFMPSGSIWTAAELLECFLFGVLVFIADVAARISLFLAS